MKVQFVKSVGSLSELPSPDRPEFAILGRSNAGKSSFLNVFTGQKMARVSQKPGKTRLLQFFDLGSKAYLVDLPGYGYATGNRREAESWKYLIENYLSSRTNLKGTLLVMDIRRPWAQEEQDLVGWLDHHKIRWAVLLSKADKLSRSQMLKRIAELKSLIGTPPVLPVSMLKRTGMEDVKKLVLEEWMP